MHMNFIFSEMMGDKKFLVILEDEYKKGCISVIPSIWVTNFSTGDYLYPSCSSNITFQRYASDCTQPTKTWKSGKITKILKEFGTKFYYFQ